MAATITVSAQSMDSTALGINTSSIINSGGAASALAAIDTAITRIADKLAALGSVAKRIEIKAEFSSKLVDILKEGVGSLVDADLASESATLQALQIQQPLGVQALAIANAGPQTVLALFQ